MFRILPELLEAIAQELIDHRLHPADLPVPVLAGARVRRFPLRKQMGVYRVGRKSTRHQGAVT